MTEMTKDPDLEIEARRDHHEEDMSWLQDDVDDLDLQGCAE